MKNLAMHITDIVQNSIRAEARLINISIVESRLRDLISISIADNGKGMSEATLTNAADPFFTTRTTRRFGFGLALLKQNAIRAGGSFKLDSVLGVGTHLVASFSHRHIDTPPMGDMACSLAQLLSLNPTIDFVYHHQTDTDTYQLDSREVKQAIDGVPISNTSIYLFLKEMISSNLEKIRN